MDQHVKIRLDRAEQHFHKAKDELQKPEYDVVPYSVCQNSYYSISYCLSGFLAQNGVEVPEPIALEDLINRCREIDTKFQELHLTPFYYPPKTEDVWMNLDTARDFLAIAEKTQQMVNQLLILSESQ